MVTTKEAVEAFRRMAMAVNTTGIDLLRNSDDRNWPTELPTPPEGGTGEVAPCNCRNCAAPTRIGLKECEYCGSEN